MRTDILVLLIIGAFAALAATTANAVTTRTTTNPDEKCPDLQVIQPVATGSYAITFGAETGSISLVVRNTAQGPLVDFTTDGPTHLVDRVIVKRGDGSMHFDYRPDGVTAATGLHAPKNPATGKYHVPSYLCVATRLKPPPPPVDVCPNIPGVQTEIPPGMIKDEAGNCVTPPPPPTDVCPNIPGNQATIPPGMIKDANGNCVTPPPAPPSVDLTIAKDDSADPVSVGRTIQYTITVTNNGPGKATGVVVTDTLPAGLEILSVRANQGTCSSSGRTITCRLGGLTPSSKAVVKVRVRSTAPGSVVNSASVTGNQPDPVPDNNTTSETTRVVAAFQPPEARCDSVTVGRRTIAVGTRTTLRVFVKANGRALAGESVRVSGAGISVSARTNRRGVAVVNVRAVRPGIVTIRVAGEICARRIGAVDSGQPDLTG